MGFFTPFVVGLVTGGIAVWQWARRTRQPVEQAAHPVDGLAVSSTVGDGIAVSSIAGDNDAIHKVKSSDTTMHPVEAPAAAKPALSIGAASLAKPHQRTDDFTLIHGIGALYAARLNAAGIHRFVQLAELTPEEVAAIVIKGPIDQLIDTRAWVAQAEKFR